MKKILANFSNLAERFTTFKRPLCISLRFEGHLRALYISAWSRSS